MRWHGPLHAHGRTLRQHDEWEVWGLNTLWQYVPDDAWHRWFEIHDPAWMEGRPGLTQQKYIGPEGWLFKDHGNRPIYTVRKEPEIPNSVPYPLKQIVDRFGHWLPDNRPMIYLQSTVDWMLVLAIAMLSPGGKPVDGATIGIWGIDMALDGDEYGHQRPSCEHWLGVALGMKINVVVPERCDIMKYSRVYGLDSFEPVAKKLQQRMSELQQRQQHAAAREQQARDEKLMLRGALDELGYRLQQGYE